MQSLIKTPNQIALEYNRSAASRLQQLCEPLQQFGIIGCTYCRLFEDGRRLYLSTDLKWTELYIDQKFYNVVEHIELYCPPPDIKYSLWSFFKQDPVFDASYELNIWNGFAIYDRTETYSEMFDFCSTRQQSQIANFYLNNLPLLKDFVETFKQKAADLINPPDEKNFITPDQKMSVYLLSHPSFIEQERIENFIKQLEFGQSSEGKREEVKGIKSMLSNFMI